MNTAIATAERVTLADLDAIANELKREDLDETARAAVRARLKKERDAQGAARRNGDGAWNQVLDTAIQAVLVQEDQRREARIAEAASNNLVQGLAKQDRARAARLERWAALSPVERALYIVAQRTGMEALVMVAKAAAAARTTEPPRNFEPESA